MSLLLSAALLVAFLLCPAASAEGVRDGLRLAARQALPALFPFFVAGGLLTRSGAAARFSRLAAPLLARLYHLPPAAAPAVVLGLIGGYPVGAATAAALLEQGELSRKDAARVVSFCNCASPGFCVSLCGLAVCGSAKIGAVLYGIHIFAALLTGCVTARRGGERDHAVPLRPDGGKESFAAAFCGAVQDATATSLTVTAFLTIFSVLLALLKPVLQGRPGAAALTGLLELTNGLSSLAETACPLGRLLPLLSLLLGFGGLAVHFQVRAVLAPYSLSLRRFTFGKVLHGGLAAALTALLCRFFPGMLAVSAPIVAVPYPSRGAWGGALALTVVFLLGAVLADFPRRKRG